MIFLKILDIPLLTFQIARIPIKVRQCLILLSPIPHNDNLMHLILISLKIMQNLHIRGNHIQVEYSFYFFPLGWSEARVRAIFYLEPGVVVQQGRHCFVVLFGHQAVHYLWVHQTAVREDVLSGHPGTCNCIYYMVIHHIYPKYNNFRPKTISYTPITKPIPNIVLSNTRLSSSK